MNSPTSIHIIDIQSQTQIIVLQSYAEDDDFPAAYDIERVKEYCQACANTMQLMLAVCEAAKDVYEFAEPTSELQQVEMLLLYDALSSLEQL